MNIIKTKLLWAVANSCKHTCTTRAPPANGEDTKLMATAARRCARLQLAALVGQLLQLESWSTQSVPLATNLASYLSSSCNVYTMLILLVTPDKKRTHAATSPAVPVFYLLLLLSILTVGLPP